MAEEATGTAMRRNIKALLLDLDGTLYFRGEPMPHAVRTLGALREMGLQLRFLTNTDSKSAATLQREVAGMGLPIGENEIFSAASAALHFLRTHPGKRCYCLVTHELAAEFAPFLATDGAVDYVLVGDFRDSVSYDRLNTAFRYVMSGAEIVALQKGRFFVNREGHNLDTGAFVELLEYASGTTARVLGKPSAEFFELAMQDTNCTPGETMVVGDDVTTDIAGAQAIGALSVLVKTGKYSSEALACSPAKPDLVIASIAELPHVLAGHSI